MKHLSIAILTLSFLFSCTDNSPMVFEEESQAIVNEITVAKGTRASNISDDEEDILTEDFSEGSILYISQMGTSETPNFPNGHSATNTQQPKNLYAYGWSEDNDTSADWNAGYNFKSITDYNPIEWNIIKSYGNVGNAFSLYAMYFPGDQKVRFNVEDDQTVKANFMKSDIMGAYHATSSLYTRLRFRLFHLMVYLRVTLYVPVYRDGLSEDNKEMKYSGFKPTTGDGENIPTVYVMNACTGFNIEWRANRSSDTEAPLTQPNGNSKADIKMYSHSSNAGKKDSDIDYINVSDYLSDYYNGNSFPGECECEHKDGNSCEVCGCQLKEDETCSGCGCDKVYVYNFSVLFPAQDFGDNNLLCFALQAPDGSKKYYYFHGSQIVGESGNYSLTQGTLQHLYLYLPRTTNETILVGANILPWADAVTDMTVTKQESEQDKKD